MKVELQEIRDNQSLMVFLKARYWGKKQRTVSREDHNVGFFWMWLPQWKWKWLWVFVGNVWTSSEFRSMEHGRVYKGILSTMRHFDDSMIFFEHISGTVVFDVRKCLQHKRYFEISLEVGLSISASYPSCPTYFCLMEGTWWNTHI